MIRVKICGLTNLDDALAAARLGADALGFIFAASPRRVEPEAVRAIIDRLPVFPLTVGVFLDAEPELVEEYRLRCRLDAVQLHGSETEETVARTPGRVIKALRVGPDRPVDVRAYPGATLLLDAYSPVAAGGTGQTFDWDLALEAARERDVILAGGLNPDNVALAATRVRPFGVDVSSGVELKKGKKDHDQLARFIGAAKIAL